MNGAPDENTVNPAKETPETPDALHETRATGATDAGNATDRIDAAGADAAADIDADADADTADTDETADADAADIDGTPDADDRPDAPGTLPEKLRTIEEELAEQGVYYGTTTGDSMEPLLHHRRQTIVLKPLDGARAEKDDVILVKREDGHYVLHRVVRVLPGGGYITRGDNRLHRDLPVPEEQVLARFDGYYHGTDFVPVNSARYRAYLLFWVKNPCRFAFLAARAAAHRVGRKLKGK